MDYSFFSYKYDIAGFDSDLFSTQHIVFIILVYVLGIFITWLFRNAKHERIAVGLKVLAVAMVLLEASKIGWETYHDVRTGRGFNYEGMLPLYTCSLFIYSLFPAAYMKGRPREYCLSFLTTISLLYGAVGVVYCNGLNFYPFWTFGAFYSMFFHSTMFVTGVFLLMTGYKKLGWADSLKAMVPVLLLSLAAIPVNYALHGAADYMLLYSGDGVPIYENLSKSLGEKGLRFIYTLIMLVTHIPLACLVIGFYKLTVRLIDKRRKKNEK